MAPKPNEFISFKDGLNDASSGERVVISGMSGLYPDSQNIKELSDILYNKINPVSDENSRWVYDHPEVAQFTGKLPGLKLFDAQFFKVHFRLGSNMDPMGRKILEQAYQAIYDAGISPEQLSGKKVGVYVGSCFSETEKACFYVASSRTGFGIAGCSKTMFANRISYWLNAKGPSMSVDDACCSSTVALELAYQAINRGECEAAIVGGSNLCLHPQSSIHYGRIMKLSMDGKTRSFDANASGCAKSEAVNVLFLQKAKNALRVYAELVHMKCEYTSILEGESGPKYGFYRDPLNMANFIEQFYKEAKVSPLEVEYVEAFGSAVPEVDKTELEAIDNIYCKGRKEPLLVGSVMSNIGYGEAASGISAVTKVLLAYQNGKIAANLDCDSPRNDIEALRDGRIRIVTEHQSFGRNYTAINGLSITGVNSHILLSGHYKPKDLSRYKSAIPRLVTISGRQESSVEKVLKDLKSRPVDPEQLALLYNIHQTRITGHLGRGYAILDTDENNQTVCLAEKSNYFDDVKRPLWFVYSGMGSQWAGMGTQLMRIPIFAAAIERCHRVLEPKGIDIVHIITSPDKTIFDNILHSFVGIAAVQIGLTDILRELGIFPDKIIGHSVGELGCAYADGCFTAEEMILSAYSRGLVSVQTPFIRGSMAAVGIGYQQVSKMCPPEIEVACHNGPDSSTISGPAEIMKEFVAELTKKDIFAKEVPCSNIAYHSRYIAEAGPGLLKYLKEVIPNPKLRSERWLSTSVPQDRWEEPIAKYSSAEYHTNNLLNSVLFEETSKLIPKNAVLIEIAPHGLLQAILKRSLDENCRHVPLTRRGHPDNAKFLLDAIGKLYMEGYNPKVEALYPKVEFPVSSGTPMLSHLVDWAHHERWNVPLYASAHRKTAASCKFVLSIHDDAHAYLKGNVVRGINVYPFSAVLVAVWDTLAMIMNVPKRQLSIQFNNIHFNTQPILHDQRQLRLNVSIQRGTGRFEVFDENIEVATGTITGNLNSYFNRPEDIIPEEKTWLDSNDLYKELKTRGYSYSDDFRSIHSSNLSLSSAQLIWKDNWVTIIDSMMQINILKRSHDYISCPNFIRSIAIDVEKHAKTEMVEVDGVTVMNASISEKQDWTRCGGISVEDIQFIDIPKNEKEIDVKALKFVPHITTNKIDDDTALTCFLHLVAENINKEVLQIVQISDNANDYHLFEKIKHLATNSITGIKTQFCYVTREKLFEDPNNFISNADLLLINNLSNDDKICQIFYRHLRRDTFVISKENRLEDMSKQRPSALYRSVCSHGIGDVSWELVHWRPSETNAGTSALTILSESDLPSLVSSLTTLPQKQRLVILTSYPAVSGLKSLIKEWRQKNRCINLIMINHKIAGDQSMDQISFTNLAVNILDHGIWGGEYFLPLEENTIKGRDMSLDIARLGDLDSLHWVEAPELDEQGVIVKVHYAGVNDVDLKTKMGAVETVKSKKLVDFDFSGKTESGISVMGVAQGESITTRVNARPEALWPIPSHWSLEDAATVPLAYLMAFYCLTVKSGLKYGCTILVHSGTGAVGQAIISIALAFGCEVFTTVNDIRKKKFLLKLFPALKADNIGSSQDVSFSDMVLKATNGQGVNIVISCVKGDLKNASLKCCHSSGSVIDTSVLPNHEDYNFGMKFLMKGLSYVTLDPSNLFKPENLNELKRIQLMMSEGIARGYVRPLSRVTFSPQEARRAYRLVAGNRHRGRVLLNLQQDIPYLQTKISCSLDRYNLVLSDDEVLGIQLAQRLVLRGARKIMLHFTSESNYVVLKIRSLEMQDVQVKVSYGDLDRRVVTKLIEENKFNSEIEGIYYIASSEMDGRKIFNNLQILNSLNQNICSQLKYFVVLSKDLDDEIMTVPLPSEKLLITRLTVPSAHDAGRLISPIDTVNAIEMALCSKRRFLKSYIPCKNERSSLLEDIAHVTGITIPENVNGQLTMRDLGMDVSKTEAVRNYLRCNFFSTMDNERILSLSVDMIRNWENRSKEKTLKETKGLSTFFSYVDHDELLAVTEMVFLPTLTTSSSIREDEFDVKQTYLCVLPGVESHHEKFRTMCERFKLPTLVLQPSCKAQESIQEMAQRLVKELINKTKLTKRFYLLGYESGVLVALEMAAILEEQGLLGTVFCIGGTPDEIQARFKKELSLYNTEEALQSEVIRHMFSLMNSDNTDELEMELKNKLTWEEKLTASLQKLLGRVPHSIQYAKEVIEAAYTRINQVRSYVPNLKKLKSIIVFMRPRESLNNGQGKEYSQNPVVEYVLEAPLAYAVQDLRCAAYVNRHLDEDILSAFEKRNLLETYILNADQFMTAALNDDD
nr:fatty acid synthase-like [Danaus plexippus plexippus]